jgi:hypothetical protein
MTFTITDIVGTTGVFLILLAYFLLITRVFHRDNILYLLMNITGAALACLASVMLDYWPFIILEAAWTLVSLFGLLRVLKLRYGN